jgi:hypothetical protein
LLNPESCKQEEAELAAALFAELRAVLLRAAAEGRLKRGCAVGVITFYKAQARLSRAASGLWTHITCRDATPRPW